ncbi:hypothetical protein M422DRAFT_254134 [Sphaerobolus stellatus SS14]|uniref:Uncharacterized protein n=1 Tax=Sphaerobolus stellatus (strain SS14) TaxID=990650 RepID=A0A0C9UHY7_SPHS4|nr:hypothetical protein M422DRAFT_254134 [Sphaerobolus stellatus SS14]
MKSPLSIFQALESQESADGMIDERKTTNAASLVNKKLQLELSYHDPGETEAATSSTSCNFDRLILSYTKNIGLSLRVLIVPSNLDSSDLECTGCNIATLAGVDGIVQYQRILSRSQHAPHHAANARATSARLSPCRMNSEEDEIQICNVRKLGDAQWKLFDPYIARDSLARLQVRSGHGSKMQTSNCISEIALPAVNFFMRCLTLILRRRTPRFNPTSITFLVQLIITAIETIQKLIMFKITYITFELIAEDVEVLLDLDDDDSRARTEPALITLSSRRETQPLPSAPATYASQAHRSSFIYLTNILASGSRGWVDGLYRRKDDYKLIYKRPLIDRRLQHRDLRRAPLSYRDPRRTISRDLQRSLAMLSIDFSTRISRSAVPLGFEASASPSPRARTSIATRPSNSPRKMCGYGAPPLHDTSTTRTSSPSTLTSMLLSTSQLVRHPTGPLLSPSCPAPSPAVRPPVPNSFATDLPRFSQVPLLALSLLYPAQAKRPRAARRRVRHHLPTEYHAGFNLGQNYVKFGLESWVETGMKTRVCQCADAEDSVCI